MNESGKLKAWVGAFRLRTLPLALSSIITGAALAYSNGQFNGTITGLAMLTTVLLQILSNLANDYGDAVKGTDNDDRIGPTRAVQSGIISQTEMKRAVIILALLSLGSGIWLLRVSFGATQWITAMVFLVLGIGAIAAAMKYTMGKNPYGYRGLGDVFVFLFFGWTGVAGTYYLQAGSLSLDLLLPASTIGLLSAGVLNLNNMRDRIADKEAGKITLAVKLGARGALKYQVSLIVLAVSALFGYTLLHTGEYSHWLFLLALPLLTINLMKTLNAQEPQHYNPLLKSLALGTFALSLLLWIGYYI